MVFINNTCTTFYLFNVHCFFNYDIQTYGWTNIHRMFRLMFVWLSLKRKLYKACRESYGTPCLYNTVQWLFRQDVHIPSVPWALTRYQLNISNSVRKYNTPFLPPPPLRHELWQNNQTIKRFQHIKIPPLYHHNHNIYFPSYLYYLSVLQTAYETCLGVSKDLVM